MPNSKQRKKIAQNNKKTHKHATGKFSEHAEFSNYLHCCNEFYELCF